MELLVNDLSLHGQFRDIFEFQSAISRVMLMRATARQFGRDLHCHRNMAQALVMPDKRFQQAIQTFGRDQQRAVMQWLTQQGPFWEDAREHTGDDYLDLNGGIVTDTAVGEAAFCSIRGLERHLVSVMPSAWMYSPIIVTFIPQTGSAVKVDVPNHWDPPAFRAILEALPAQIASWEQLAQVAMLHCQHLTFATESFLPLRGSPFAEGAAHRLLILLSTLDLFKTCFDADGHRTQQGHEIFTNHFAGDKAWFSDSSDTEKAEWKRQLTFPHPADDQERLFCTWHGKVKTPQLRIHFSWPVRADEPLYVVYVGPKITMR